MFPVVQMTLILRPKRKNNQSTDTAIDTTVDKELYFYSDVRPVIDRTCIHCHYEGGRSFDMNGHDAVVTLPSI